MPELPECETITRELRASVIGRTITALMVRSTCMEGILKTPYDNFYSSLIGETIQTVLRRGKYIILPLSNHSVLVFHLGMTGSIRLSDITDGGNILDRTLPPPGTDDHCHLVLELADFSEVIFSKDLGPISSGNGYVDLSFYDPRRFGRIWLLTNVTDINNLDIAGIRNLGPDALDIPLEEFSALTSNTKRTVKSLLLDQTKLAGVGNIYADEACFAAKIHPARNASGLDKVENAKLWFSVKTVLNEGIRFGGSSISDFTSTKGEKGSYQKRHRVYGKKGVPCVECGTPIEKLKIVGRSTHFCPSCQVR